MSDLGPIQQQHREVNSSICISFNQQELVKLSIVSCMLWSYTESKQVKKLVDNPFQPLYAYHKNGVSRAIGKNKVELIHND